MISENFLWFALFFPRITLLYSYFYGNVPPNPVPLLIDFFLFILFPRLLIAFYIFINDGLNSWFWIFVIAGLLSITIRWTRIKNKQ